MDYSRLIASTGLFASGMTAGVAAAYPLLINHFFIRSDQGLSLNQRLAIWHRSYTAGAGCIPFLALPAAASYITYALNYARTTGSKQALIGAAVLHLAIIPFTLISIAPTNNILIGHLNKAKADAATVTDEEKIRPLFDYWVQLHNVRVALSVAGFAVGIANTLGYF